MATTATFDVLAATTCTGEATVDPFTGLQIITDRLPLVPEQPVPPCTVTVADELLLPPAPVAVAT